MTTALPPSENSPLTDKGLQTIKKGMHTSAFIYVLLTHQKFNTNIINLKSYNTDSCPHTLKLLSGAETSTDFMKNPVFSRVYH